MPALAPAPRPASRARPPSRARRSNSTTRCPRAPPPRAASSPATPPPTTTTRARRPPATNSASDGSRMRRVDRAVHRHARVQPADAAVVDADARPRPPARRAAFAADPGRRSSRASSRPGRPRRPAPPRPSPARRFRPRPAIGTPTASRNRIARSLKTPSGSWSPGTKYRSTAASRPVPPLTLKRSIAPVDARLGRSRSSRPARGRRSGTGRPPSGTRR